MRRILLLITDLEIGGTPTVVRELAIRLATKGAVEIEVACLAPWGPVADQLKHAGIHVTAFDAGGVQKFPAIVWRLARLIHNRKIDTVFSFLLHANAVAAAASRIRLGVRWLQSIQTTQPTPAWHWKVQSLAQHSAERIVVPSPSVARVAMDWACVASEKIVVIPNAVSSGMGFQPLSGIGSELQASNHGLEARATEIGFIGRLDPIKRIPDLLEAMTLLDASTHLHIFGQGSERQNIQRAIEHLNLHGRVTLHGAIARPEEALRQIDLLVLPSQAEGFGLVLIEAMAAGIPVVGTDVPGIRDVVRNGETGLLVSVASPAKLARAIKSLLDDAILRQRIVANGLEDVRRRFSWDVVLPQYQRLLDI